ncbi:MAG: hypothetical protein J6C61_02915 [Clostridia bacterium]|nr:hypothetical protein [Clostridia bacterium]
MAKKLLLLVLALLLIVYALFSFVVAFFNTMEWIRVHIDLIGALFNGNVENVFDSMFLYYGGTALNSPWLSKVINFITYNMSLVMDYLFALIGLVGGLAIAVCSLASGKKSKIDKNVEDLVKRFDKFQLINETKTEEKVEAPAQEEQAEAPAPAQEENAE